MPEIAKEIMLDLEKLAGMVESPQAREALRVVLEPMPALIEAEEEATRRLRAYYKARRESNRKIIEHMAQRSAALRATLSEISEKLASTVSGLPEAIPVPKFNQLSKKLEDSATAPALLSPRELRDQIIKKAMAQPPSPRTTGNIWENWTKAESAPEQPPVVEDEGEDWEDNP